jgi:predicted dienelactone hydrolase
MLKGVAIVAAVTVLGIIALLASMRLEHTMSTTLPTPTGSFAVGRAIHVWGDDATDSLAPVPGVKRELLVWIWYPSPPGQSAAIMDDYVPAPMRAAAERARGPVPLLGTLMTKFLTRDPSKVHAHSIRNADLSPQQRSYPVVIMRAGASTGVTNYSTLAEDLASHGYVVVGFDAPYRTGLVVFPDGRVVGRTNENNPELVFGAPDSARRISRLVAAWTRDVAFALDQLQRLNVSDSSGKFTGRLDMNRVGVFGHSFGGATALQFCHDDARCKAGIDVDGAPVGNVIRDGIPRPFMFLLSDHGDSSSADTRQIKAAIQSIYDRLPPDGRVRVVIRGANHFLFNDDVALLKSHILLALLRGLGAVNIEGRRQLAVTTHCIHTFFDHYLKGAGGSRLSIASPLYPEITILE